MRVAAVLVVGDAGGGVHVQLHGVARRQLQQDALADHGLALDGGFREFNKPQLPMGRSKTIATTGPHKTLVNRFWGNMTN